MIDCVWLLHEGASLAWTAAGSFFQAYAAPGDLLKISLLLVAITVAGLWERRLHGRAAGRKPEEAR